MNAKANDLAKNATKTMLDAHVKLIEATMQQTKIAEEQTAAMFAATRRNAELQKDLVNNLAKVWMDALSTETKSETK